MEKVLAAVSTYVHQQLGWTNPHCTLIARLATGGYAYRVAADSSESAERYIVRVGMPLDEAEDLVRFSEHFASFGVSVARVVAYDFAAEIMIQEDLGTRSLLDVLRSEQMAGGEISGRVEGLYQQALRELVIMQIPAGKKLISEYAGRTVPFNREKLLEDLAYFSGYFVPHLMIAGMTGGTNGFLAEEFERFATYLDRLPREYFYYRDLNTRNIFIKGERCYFLDIVGGRRGFTGCLTAGLEPSVIGLVNHARAGLSLETRERLLTYYLSEVERYEVVDRGRFFENYHNFALLKLLQILGWYGKAGLVDGQQSLVASIPNTLRELQVELTRGPFPVPMPRLEEVLKRAWERYGV